jgi:hypothetical protein
MTNSLKPTFEELKAQLLLSTDGSLTLNGLPMILLPRHFFRYVIREVKQLIGAEAFEQMCRQVGYDGAVTFCEAFEKSHNCSPKEALIGYLNEMSIRGWGQFKIKRVDEINGEAEVWLANSALPAEGNLPTGNTIWEGAVLGALAHVQRNVSGVKHKAESVQGRVLEGDSRNYIISVTPAAVRGDGE